MTEDPSSHISDSDLMSFVRMERLRTPTIGESLLTGSLRSHGYHVTRDRIRHALHSSDPLGSALRWPGGLSRRHPYSVAGPNSLWHIGEP